jgi:hypothetical protein
MVQLTVQLCSVNQRANYVSTEADESSLFRAVAEQHPVKRMKAGEHLVRSDF